MKKDIAMRGSVVVLFFIEICKRGEVKRQVSCLSNAWNEGELSDKAFTKRMTDPLASVDTGCQMYMLRISPIYQWSDHLRPVWYHHPERQMSTWAVPN